MQGCTGIGLRRASLFGRAPVIHDLRIAYTIWGWLDPYPPADLLAMRREAFDGVAEVLHNYDRLRDLADSVPTGDAAVDAGTGGGGLSDRVAPLARKPRTVLTWRPIERHLRRFATQRRRDV